MEALAGGEATLDVLLPTESCSTAELLRRLVLLLPGIDQALVLVLDVEVLGSSLTRRDLLQAARFHAVESDAALVLRAGASGRSEGRVGALATTMQILRAAVGAVGGAETSLDTLETVVAKLGEGTVLLNLLT
jgi:hypothetical protein